MACTVEVKDITKTIKQELLNLEGVTPTSSGVFFSFNTENPDSMSKELLSVYTNQKDIYQVGKYGNIFDVSKEENGFRIDITPSQQLADDMTQQNYEDDAMSTIDVDNQRAGINVLDDQGYLYNSRHEATDFVGDNYQSFLKYKQEQSTKVQSQINTVEYSLKNANLNSDVDLVSLNTQLNNLQKELAQVNSQITELLSQPQEYIFHAIEEDLNALQEAVESTDYTPDLFIINKKLDFYDDFMASSTEEDFNNNPKYVELRGRVVDLINKSEKVTIDNARKAIENDEAVKEIQDKHENLDLFNIKNDINFFEYAFLGVSADRTDNTIVPQMIFKHYSDTLRNKQGYIEKLNKKLYKLVETNPDKLSDVSFVKERFDEGGLTGYLTDIFTPSYYKGNFKYKKALEEYQKIPSKSNYNKVLKSLLENNELVDFTKIRDIKEVYGGMYSEYFNSTEDEMDVYEKQLQNLLGSKYDSTVEHMMSRLESYENKKDIITDPTQLATQNVWEFNKTVNSGGNRFAPMQVGDNKVFYNNFNDAVYLPRSYKATNTLTDAGMVTKREDTNFYNKAFKEIEKDPVLLEYYDTVKEISEYISSTYDYNNLQRIPFPKVQQQYAERITQAYKDKGLASVLSVPSKTLEEYKSWFYSSNTDLSKQEKDTVKSNNSDTFLNDVRQLTDAYVLKGMDKTQAFEKASDELSRQYEGDFNASLIAAAMEAAIHSARLESQPDIRAMINLHKSISKDQLGTTDTRAIKKLEGYYNSIVLNVNQSKSDQKLENKTLKKGSILHKIVEAIGKLPFIKTTSKSLDLLSDTEKKLFSEYQDILDSDTPEVNFNFKDKEGVIYTSKKQQDGTFKYYEGITGDVAEVKKSTYDKALASHLENKVDGLGLNLSLAGFVDGVLKTVIFKGLGLNPVSGIFNRIEGKHSSMLMDATGEYWTPGNIYKANGLMSFVNILKMANGKLPLKNKKDKKTLEVFETLVEQFNIFQDRKNELQRSAEEASFTRKFSNPFIWAVENPEFKNQGAIMLSIMMDFQVKNDKGEMVPLLNKKNNQFEMSVISEDGTLNIEEDQVNKIVLKMTDAVSRSQGNYNANDIMMAKQSLWGRAGVLFMTWFAEHLNQRVGISGKDNVNLNTGEKRRHGRFIEAFRTNKLNTSVAGFMGLSVAYGLSPIAAGIAGAGVLSTFVYKKYVQKIAGPESVRQDINYAKELADFMKSILIESLNYPVTMLNKQPLIKNNTFSYLTKEETAAMKGLTRELAVVLTWLGIKLAMGALLYDDEDDKESPQRMKHNFIQNQLSRTINTLTVYANPEELVTDHSRIALLSHLGDVNKVLMATWNEKQREDLGKNLLKVSPIPRILTAGKMPWHDKMNYDEMSNMSGIPSPLKWTSTIYKDKSTEGTYSAKREYNDILKGLREEIKEDLMDKHKGKKKPLSKEVSTALKEKIGGYKKKDQTYKEKLEELKGLGF